MMQRYQWTEWKPILRRASVASSDSRKHELVWCRKSDLRDHIQCEGDVDLPPVSLLPVGLSNAHSNRTHGLENCSMFRVSQDGSLLVVSNSEALIVLRYRAETLLYEVEKRVDTETLCSSIQLTPFSIIFSSDKVYSMELRNYEVSLIFDLFSRISLASKQV